MNVNTHEKILAENSKSFNWASKLFPKEERNSIALLYFFCRTLDDVADEEGRDNSTLLNNIKELIINETNKEKKINDFQGLYNTYQTLGLNKEISIHLLDGLIFDQKSVQIRDEKELIEYCYRVAGTVGLLMCPILGCKNKEAFKFAVDLGVGMQMTNIARDVFEDSNLNRRYLPGTWINSMTAREIRDCSQHPHSDNYRNIKIAIDRILNLAQEYYDSGRLGLSYLPLRSRFGIAVASNIYQGIGNKIKLKNFDWGKSRAFTTIFDKILATLYSTKYFLDYRQKFPKHAAYLHNHLKEFEHTW